MRAALKALQQTSLACMASLGRAASHSLFPSRAVASPAACRATFSSQPSRPRALMPSPWSSVRSAFMRTVTSRPFAAAVGATVVGTGVWVAHGQWWQHQHHHAMSTSGAAGGPASRTVTAASYSSGDSAAATPNSAPPQLLVLAAGAAMIPHPAKEDKGGEDAFFICEHGLCMGVADGVGGWAEIGVDPGLYSRELMDNAKAATKELPPGEDRPQRALELAHSRTVARGSSTACIICVHEGRLHASNLGDSGFMVVRDGELAFMSPQQQHEFNFPYQIGSSDSMADSPGAAQRFTLDVEPGDIVVAATDGVFDNVYPDEAAALVSLAQRKGDGPQAAATTLAEFARTRAADPTHLSPFAYGAQQLGFRYFGGKMDDITVVCAYIEEGKGAKAEGEDGVVSAATRSRL